MLFNDDDTNLRGSYLLIGQDLSDLSADELHERIQLCEDEMKRSQQELSGKGDSRAAAEALFRAI